MSRITDEALTRKVADLARLELTDAEVTTFTGQIEKILAYVGQLESADVEGIEPLTHPNALALSLATPFREDVAKPFATDSEGKPKILGAAPDVQSDGFKVPPIL